MKMYMIVNLSNQLCQLFKYEKVELLELLNFESKIRMKNGVIARASNQNLFMTLKDAYEHVKELTGA